MKRLLTKISALSFLLVLFGSVMLYSQTGSSKLAGKVIDADTKESLIGANILIMGTGLGAATDINGEYFVLNVTPGTYDVRVSFVGYASQTIQNVRMVAGVTYELNVELSTDFTLPEIIVREDKFFEEKATNTVRVIDQEQISRVPVRGVENLASMEAGVVIAEGSGGVSGNASINVRGGRGNEVLYIIDGVAQNDLLFGGNNAQVSNAAIDQISFQIGGYEAKYGQAQSGIVNVTTRSGSPSYSIFADVISSSFTDDYGYNLYTTSIGGPIIPGNANHTIFLLGERGWFLDGNPKAIPVEVPTVNFYSKHLPNNSSDIWRFTGRTFHNFSPFTLRLGANVNTRNKQNYIHSFAKQNRDHNSRFEEANYSFNARLSHNVSSSTFYNINVGLTRYTYESGDGRFFDNLEAYGDTLQNTYLQSQGSVIGRDRNGVFWLPGRVSGGYSNMENQTITTNFDLTTQYENHLIEIGGGFDYNTLRYFSIGPISVSRNMRGPNAIPYVERLKLAAPYYFGYDITGKTKVDETNQNTAPYPIAPNNPIILYGYIQDRFELSDLVLNVGVRFDYFDSKADIIKNESLPAGNDAIFDPSDFIKADPEFYVSPRIGIGFPVTSTTVFHAQYGKFIQQPRLIDVYTNLNELTQRLIDDNNWDVNTGNVNSEVTTQYEIGFRQIVGDNLAALNITAFYKNTKGLVNRETRFYQRTEGGQIFRFFGPANADFGTIKGLALSLDIGRISYFSATVNYTYSLAEGTGSSTESSFWAAFRNTSGEVPKVVAPLDFDQRHTGVINVDLFIPKGDLGIFEQLGLNLLFTFNSGRPYTPLENQNILAGASNFGDTKGYVNSAYGPGSSRLDLKLQKTFNIGKLEVTPYLWVENVFDQQNTVNVYRSTGSPYTSGWLNTDEGRAIAAGNPGYAEDYTALERNPSNFGIPRQIKLGLRLNLAGIYL